MWGMAIGLGLNAYGQHQADQRAKREAEKTTAAEREAYKQAQESWARYKDTYMPLMNDAIADAKTLNADWRANDLAAERNAGYMADMSANLGAIAGDPSRGSTQSQANDLIRAATVGSAMDKAKASTDTRSNYLGQMTNLVDMGHNIGTSAMNAYGNRAAASGAVQTSRVNGGMWDGLAATGQGLTNAWAGDQFYQYRQKNGAQPAVGSARG